MLEGTEQVVGGCTTGHQDEGIPGEIFAQVDYGRAVEGMDELEGINIPCEQGKGDGRSMEDSSHASCLG